MFITTYPLNVYSYTKCSADLNTARLQSGNIKFDSRSNICREMSAEDVLCDMLHSEIVSYLVSKCSEDEDLSILEHLGYSCGWRLIVRITKELPRFKEEQEVLKFMCTDFWSCVYKKKVDNLRTYHQGIYVLHDNEFCFFSKLSNGTQYLKSASQYATFTCGLIRGALEHFGISIIVTVEIIRMPSCKFYIQVLSSSS